MFIKDALSIPIGKTTVILVDFPKFNCSVSHCAVLVFEPLKVQIRTIFFMNLEKNFLKLKILSRKIKICSLLSIVNVYT